MKQLLKLLILNAMGATAAHLTPPSEAAEHTSTIPL